MRSIRLPRPVVTTGLMGVCVAIFLAMTLTGVSITDPRTDQLVKWGANYGPLTLGGQPWRLFTAMFLHFGLVHIVMNMWSLWNLGELTEFLYGRATFLAVYLLSGLGGSLASTAWHPTGASAGASGAIFGIAGALLAALYFGRVPIKPASVKNIRWILLVFMAFNLYYGAVKSEVDNAAHVGGLLTGFIIGVLLSGQLLERTARAQARRRNVTGAAVLVLLFCFFAVHQARGYVVHLQRGEAAIESNKLELAKSELRQAVGGWHDDAYGRYLLGYIYLRQGDNKSAQAQFQRAIAIQPKFAKAYYDSGWAYLLSKSANDARAAFQRALQLEPTNEEAAVGVGLSYEMQGKQEEAAEAFHQALKINPKSALAYYQLGLLSRNTGKLDDAIVEFQKSLQIEPQDAAVETALAESYDRLGLSEEAAAARARAAKIKTPPAHNPF